jgi:hypothetical protein
MDLLRGRTRSVAERTGPPDLGQEGAHPGAPTVREAQRQDQYGRWIRFRHGQGTEADLRGQARGRVHEKGLPALPGLLHRRLDGPVTIVRDNCSSHISKHVKQCTQQHDRLAVVQLPSYAPELNPVY